MGDRGPQISSVRPPWTSTATTAPSDRRPAVVGHGLRPELSDRELEVLRLIARGASNGEIAERLFISQATVKSHVTNILMKLDLRDRAAAIVFAFDQGLVEPGAPA